MGMQTIDDAWAALQHGDRARAELVAVQLVESARANHGTDTPGHARALGHLAAVLVAMGDLQSAMAVLRRAAAVEGTDDATVRAQLTHLTHLGEVLRLAGHADEAVAVLEGSLVRRRRVHGDHPAVGITQLALADARRMQGDLDRASADVGEACRLLTRHGHAHRFAARALQAEIRAARHSPPYFDAIEDEGQLAAAVRVRAASGRPADLIAVVAELLGHAEDPALLALLAQLAHRIGNADVQVDALHRLRAWHEAHGEADRTFDVTLGLALVTPQEADTYYREALDQAAQTTRPNESRSRALRNRAGWLIEAGRPAEAEPVLRAAADVADPELRGRALAALGLLRIAQGQAGEADLLEALTTLPPAHPDALRARQALRAQDRLETGLVEALEAVVRPHVPDGLLDTLTVDPEGQLGFRLLREASDAEVEHLWRVVRQGIVQLQQASRPR